MRPGPSSGNQLISHSSRQRDVNQRLAVNMADFPTANTIFGAAKSMRRCFDSGPREDYSPDSLGSRLAPILS